MEREQRKLQKEIERKRRKEELQEEKQRKKTLKTIYKKQKRRKKGRNIIMHSISFLFLSLLLGICILIFTILRLN